MDTGMKRAFCDDIARAKILRAVFLILLANRDEWLPRTRDILLRHDMGCPSPYHQRKERVLSGRRRHSESVPDICLAPSGVLRGTGSWPHSSNPGRRVVKDASRAPRESAFCWQFA